jgi:hypothetical protein
MKRLLFVALAAVLWSAPALADLTITMSSGKPGGKDRTTGTMYATTDKLSTFWNQGKDKSSGAHMIFDAGKQTMWIIDDNEKSYMVLDKATLDEMAKQLDQVDDRMKEAMANLPPEQRQMMEKQMAKLKGGAGQEMGERKVIKTGESKSVSGFTCSRFDVSRGGTVQTRIWAAPFGAVKVSEADMAVFTKMGKMFESMTSRVSQFANNSANPWSEGGEIDGMPILTERMEDGKVAQETLIESITNDAPPAGAFDVPAGYKKREMPKMDPSED